jgi:sugar phosphate isomerase/epimerase
MKFAIFTVSLPEWTPDEAVRELKAAGYDGIEWRVVDDPQMSNPTATVGFWSGNRCTLPLSSLIDDAPRIRTMTDGAGLAIPGLGTYVLCDEPADVERAMKGAQAMGVSALRVRAPNYDGSVPYLKLMDKTVGEYRDVEAMAKQHGVRALIEMHMNNVVPSASACRALVQHFDPRHIGIIHDAGNMVYEGYENYRLGLEVLGPYLAHVHLKNAQWTVTGTRADGSTEWKAGFASIPKGVVDMRRLLDAVRTVGYDGWVSFEDFSTEVPLAQRIRDNINYIKSLL